MLYFLFGPDTYRSKQKLKELLEKYQTDFEIHKIDGENIKFEELRNKINSISIFSSKRLFVIENLSLNKNQQQITSFLKDANLYARTEDYVNNILIFWEEKINKNTSLYKFLSTSHITTKHQARDKKKADENFVFEFNQLDNNELKKWVNDYVKQKAGKIESMAIQDLTMNGKNNLWKLSQELDKLLAYNKNITLDNICLLTNSNFDNNIFNLTDAIGTGNKVTALELINKQLESGMQPIYLLSMIIRQFRILIQVKEKISPDFKTRADSVKELGLHPFIVQKSIGQSQKYSFEQLEKIYQDLQKIDLQLKSSKLSPEVLFNYFIFSH